MRRKNQANKNHIAIKRQPSKTKSSKKRRQMRRQTIRCRKGSKTRKRTLRKGSHPVSAQKVAVPKTEINRRPRPENKIYLQGPIGK